MLHFKSEAIPLISFTLASLLSVKDVVLNYLPIHLQEKILARQDFWSKFWVDAI